MVKNHLPELFAPGSAEHDAARAIAARVHELSQFLVDVLHADDVGAAFPHRVTYDDSCHLLRERARRTSRGACSGTCAVSSWSRWRVPTPAAASAASSR